MLSCKNSFLFSLEVKVVFVWQKKNFLKKIIPNILEQNREKTRREVVA
jgi:hypothetical protein